MTTTLLERAAGKGQLSPDEDQLFQDVAGLSYSGESVPPCIMITHRLLTVPPAGTDTASDLTTHA